VREERIKGIEKTSVAEKKNPSLSGSPKGKVDSK
jgi:hypothetical protein